MKPCNTRSPRNVHPHKLDLYEQAVQHPEAEAHFLMRAYAHYRSGTIPTLLREDFAGSAAVSRAWVAFDPQQQAMAIENHQPTLRWGFKRAIEQLGERADDLHVVHADVLSVRSPRVDVIAALNFSSFIYHDRASLRQYFRHARTALLPEGIFVLDAFGGPGAMRVGLQQRKMRSPTLGPFVYQWEQTHFEPATSRIDCSIHFELEDGRTIRHAFRYHWRLWTLPELCELMLEAGFTRADIWCDSYDPATRQSSGDYQPTITLGAREDFVAYVVGVK